MKHKRRNSIRYNDSVLKTGYEAMAQINLGFAESGLTRDFDEFVSYEKVLANNTVLERDGFED